MQTTSDRVERAGVMVADWDDIDDRGDDATQLPCLFTI